MKLIKILLFLLVSVALIGCVTEEPDDGDNNDNNNGDEIKEPSLKIDSTEYTIKEDETLQLTVEIIDGEQDLGIIFYSDDSKVASVSSDGLVKGESVGATIVNIRMSNYPDQELHVVITVEEKEPELTYEEQLAIGDFQRIREEIEAIDDVTTGNILLKARILGRSITWNSSHPEVISTFGIVNRMEDDVEVELTATMSYERITEVVKKVITVEKRLPFPDLSTKKVTFAYSRNIIMNDEHLKKLDVVNYAFAGITTSFAFSLTSEISSLVRSAHNNGTKLVISVGGGTIDGANAFVAMTNTPQNRAIFIASMMKSIENYNLDGIDYDWESPANATQKANFTALVKETYEAFQAYDSNLILSAAVGANHNQIYNRFDVAELDKYFDYWHIMSYDLNDWAIGKDNGTTWHHTNLYKSEAAPSSFSADIAIKAYIAAGATKQKIVMGAAAYGRMATNVQSTGDGLWATGYQPQQSIRFSEIYTRIPEFNPTSNYVYYYDEVAEAPWIFDGSTFISFDDRRSIAAKSDYVIEHDLAGVMYWDYTSDTSGHIIDYIVESLYK